MTCTTNAGPTRSPQRLPLLPGCAAGDSSGPWHRTATANSGVALLLGGQPSRGLRRFKAAVFQLYLPPMRWALRRADLVVFQTERQCAHFGAGWHLAPMRHMILPSGHTMHGEDVSLAAPPERAVLWLGGIKDVKRPELFAVLARDLVKDGVQCRMAGKAVRQEAERLARGRTSLRDKPKLLGRVTRSEVLVSWSSSRPCEHEQGGGVSQHLRGGLDSRKTCGLLGH